MKRILLLTLPLLGACTRTLFPDPTGPEKLIALEARLNTADTLHTVYASYSLHDDVVPADDLTIACYVNGEKKAETTEYEAYTTQANAYRLRADIAPGDVVRIVAVPPGGAANAEAEATAPPAPLLERVEIDGDLSGVGNGETLLVRIRLKDTPGERNWYRLQLFRRQETVDVTCEEHFGPSRNARCGHVAAEVFPGTEKEPLLNPTASEPADQRDRDYFLNRHNFFTDELFMDGTYTLQVRAAAALFLLPELSSWTDTGDYWDEDSGKIVRYPMVYRTDREMVVRISALTRTDFLRARLWEQNRFSLTGFYFFDELFSEEMAYPENVQGGIGCVSVRSVSEIRQDLGSVRFDCDQFDRWRHPGIL